MGVIVLLMPPSPKAESFLRAQETLGPFLGSDRSQTVEDLADSGEGGALSISAPSPPLPFPRIKRGKQ